ncbi:MAG: Eco57I restriction-modification methylase domain-containing protein [Dissulfurispiraceae bacterium]
MNPIERPSRISGFSTQEISMKLKEYVEQAVQLNTAAAKAQRFSILLNDVFREVKVRFVEDSMQGVKEIVRAKRRDIILKSGVEALYGNVIIGFEHDLKGKLDEEIEQLKRYILCMLHARDEGSYLCLATDGILFYVFYPRIIDASRVELEEVETIDFARTERLQSLFRLERYFLRRRGLLPNREEIVRDFGVKSPAFKYCLDSLERVWRTVKDRADFSVAYDTWSRYLRVACGSFIRTEELFLSQSYLAIFMKLVSYLRLSETHEIPSTETIVRILNGELFEAQGIDNFLEEDFFAWIVREPARAEGIDLSRKLIFELASYDLSALAEDVLKSLHQEVAAPPGRAHLEGHYTPDWLAQRVQERMLKDNPVASVLDPCCGSGTFLYTTIRYKKRLLGSTLETLDHIIRNVVGIDVHPLAVITAKTNYLLALGDLLKDRGSQRVQIPVYLADAINPPEDKLPRTLLTSVPCYQAALGEKPVYIPDTIMRDAATYDNVIEWTGKFARHSAGTASTTPQEYEKFLRQHVPHLPEKSTIDMLFSAAMVMKELIEEEKDGIWAYVVKNSYKPLFLKEKFDVVIGNPPWFSFRDVDRGTYREALKAMIAEKYKLLSGRADVDRTKMRAALITRMELATLYFLRAADLYLKDGGIIGFVMPRSVFTGAQHDVFRTQGYSIRLGQREFWDLEKVNPLFDVPACVVMAKKGILTSPPYKAEFIAGFVERSAGLPDAEKTLTVAQGRLYLAVEGQRSFFSPSQDGCLQDRKSPYHSMFKRGATIVPRNFWFVDIKPHTMFGIDPSAPYVETSKAAEKTAKAAYKDILMKGTIEKEFLYATLLCADIVPFGHLNFRPIVMPLVREDEGYSIIKEGRASKKGFHHLSRWLHTAQKIWDEKRGEKAKKMDIYQRLDRVKGLTGQKPLKKYIVLYLASAMHLCGCVIEQEAVRVEIGGQTVEIQGVIADHKTYIFQSDIKSEVYYLCAMLNSALMDELMRPLLLRGLHGIGDIHKHVWELPIPIFDPSSEKHADLARLGEGCSKKVSGIVSEEAFLGSIGTMRKSIKSMLGDEIKEIDGIAKRILRL